MRRGTLVLTLVLAAVSSAAARPIDAITTDGETFVRGGDHDAPVLSASGRFVAFYSDSPGFVPGDDNRADDVFVRDMKAGRTTRVSVRSDGSAVRGFSTSPSISADGRLVAFTSTAETLAPGDGNGETDVFVHDRRAGTTVLVSRVTGGAAGNGRSGDAHLSPDGRFVVFSSRASDLAPQDTDARSDVFVHDLVTGATGLVSGADDGASDTPVIAADGRFIAFRAAADIVVRNMLSGAVRPVNRTGGGEPITVVGDTISIAGDGSRVAFAGRPPQARRGSEVYVRDLADGTTRIVSSRDGKPSTGTSAQPSISLDGRVVAFDSSAQLVPGQPRRAVLAFAYDLRRKRIVRPVVRLPPRLRSNHDEQDATLSGDGSFIAFSMDIRHPSKWVSQQLFRIKLP